MKKFELRDAENKEGQYAEFLKVINDAHQKAAKVIIPEGGTNLFEKLHEEAAIDSSQEFEKYEKTRQGICSAFGINDEKHIICNIGEEGPERQRKNRVFYVLIDMTKSEKEAFYAEGRTAHNNLLNDIILVAGLNKEDVYSGIMEEPPCFLMFKGFLYEDTGKVNEEIKKILETPIFYKTDDGDLKRVEVHENWFISGHNLPSE